MHSSLFASFRVVVFFLFFVFLFCRTVHATVSWNQADMSLSYNYSENALTVQVFIPVESIPATTYEAQIIVNNREYDQTLRQYSVTQNLYILQKIPLSIESLSESYSIVLKIREKNTGREVYATTFNKKVENYIPFSQMEIRGNYVTQRQELQLSVTIPNIATNPFTLLYSHIEIAGKTHQATFQYLSFYRYLQANHSIAFPLPPGTGTEYPYTLTVKDHSGKTFFTKRGTLRIVQNQVYESASISSHICSQFSYRSEYVPESQSYRVFFSFPYMTGTTRYSGAIYDTTPYKNKIRDIAFVYNSQTSRMEGNVVFSGSYSSILYEITENHATICTGVISFVASSPSNTSSTSLTPPSSPGNAQNYEIALPWNQTQVRAIYNVELGILLLDFFLPFTRRVDALYTIYGNIQGVPFYLPFSYDSQLQGMKGSVMFPVSIENVGNEYNIMYVIKSSAGRELYSGRNTLQTEFQKYSGKDSIPWNNFYIDNFYNKNEKKLFISFGWDFIELPPKNTYVLKLFLGESIVQTEPIRYSSKYKKLYTQYSIFLGENTIKTSYPLYFQVFLSGNTLAEFSKHTTLYVNVFGKTTSTSHALLESRNGISQAELLNRFYTFLDGFERKYTWNQERIVMMKRIISQLQTLQTRGNIDAFTRNYIERFLELLESQLRMYEFRAKK